MWKGWERRSRWSGCLPALLDQSTHTDRLAGSIDAVAVKAGVVLVVAERHVGQAERGGAIDDERHASGHVEGRRVEVEELDGAGENACGGFRGGQDLGLVGIEYIEARGEIGCGTDEADGCGTVPKNLGGILTDDAAHNIVEAITVQVCYKHRRAFPRGGSRTGHQVDGSVEGAAPVSMQHLEPVLRGWVDPAASRDHIDLAVSIHVATGKREYIVCSVENR